MQSWEYTPTYRGFDSFSGYFLGEQHYFNHSKGRYFDLRENEGESLDVDAQEYGVWWERDKAIQLLTDLKDRNGPFFLYLAWQAAHAPNEAPKEYVDRYSDAQSATPRHYKQAQTTILDESVEDVVVFLKDNDLWEDTLIVVECGLFAFGVRTLCICDCVYVHSLYPIMAGNMAAGTTIRCGASKPRRLRAG